MPELREIVAGLLHCDRYIPWPVQIRAAPTPSRVLAAYNNHVLGNRNDTIKVLENFGFSLDFLRYYLLVFYQ